MSATQQAFGQVAGGLSGLAALAWAIWCTPGGRRLVDTVKARRDHRRQQVAHAAYVHWLTTLTWWGQQLAQHGSGTRQYEAARAVIHNLNEHRPPRCDCPLCSPGIPRLHERHQR